jgi:hypothetical protein
MVFKTTNPRNKIFAALGIVDDGHKFRARLQRGRGQDFLEDNRFRALHKSMVLNVFYDGPWLPIISFFICVAI